MALRWQFACGVIEEISPFVSVAFNDLLWSHSGFLLV